MQHTLSNPITKPTFGTPTPKTHTTPTPTPPKSMPEPKQPVRQPKPQALKKTFATTGPIIEIKLNNR